VRRAARPPVRPGATQPVAGSTVDGACTSDARSAVGSWRPSAGLTGNSATCRRPEDSPLVGLEEPPQVDGTERGVQEQPSDQGGLANSTDHDSADHDDVHEWLENQRLGTPTSVDASHPSNHQRGDAEACIGGLMSREVACDVHPTDHSVRASSARSPRLLLAGRVLYDLHQRHAGPHDLFVS